MPGECVVSQSSAMRILGDGAQETHDRCWYAVYTLPRHEKTVAQQIASREIESYLPLYYVIHTHRGRRSKTEQPLFPGYLFTKIARFERLNVLTAPGVVRLVSVAGQPAPIPDEEIVALRKLLSTHKAEPIAYMGRGKRVRFTDGPFEGLEGTITRTKSGARVIVSVDLIMRSMSVEVDSGQLEILRNSLSTLKKSTGAVPFMA
jgi:transcription antitermination factor NusG